MTASLAPALYALAGTCACAAVQHGVGALRKRGQRGLLLFSALSLLAMGAALSGAGAVQPGQGAAAMRRSELAIACLFFAAFPWFLAEYTNAPGRRVAGALALAWGALFAATAVNAASSGPWQYALAAALLGTLVYALHACIATWRKGRVRTAWALAGAVALLFAAVLLDAVWRRHLVGAAPPGEFGFLGLLVLMAARPTQDLRDPDRRMRSVLDHVPAAISLKDAQGRYRLVNRAFENVFQVCDTALRGKGDADLFQRELAERFDADERRALASGLGVEREDAMELNGESRDFQRYVFPLLRSNGARYGVCSVRLDVTEARRKERALYKVRRQVWHTDRVASVGALSVSLAHELSQPLCAILSNAQAGLRFLAHDPVDLAEIRAIFHDIVRDEKRASAVLQGLRAFLRKQEVPFGSVDLGQCVDETLDLLHSEILRRGAELERELDSEIAVRANKTQVQQVVLNLVTNALEAMADQPEDERILQVRASRDGALATVSVCDNGPGIPNDALGRVFEGFHTTKAQGLGIGLAVCKSIVESHKGRIWVEPNPGRGVTVSFSLPVERETLRQA